MKNYSEINYFNIGIFILTGISLIIAALLIFGSNKLFQRTVYIETYFEESVQGISEGYPVKYRGLQIGYVKKIAFSNEIYKNAPPSTTANQKYSRSIYVLLAITSKLFTNLSETELNDLLTKEVTSGLRVKIMPQGITGTTYIELNYIDPKNSPIPKLYWEPKNFYMPSSPGILTQISDSAQSLLNQLKDVDFKKLFENISSVMVSLDQVTKKTNQVLDKNKKPLEVMMQNFQDVSDNLRTLSEQIKLYPSQLLFGGSPPPLDPSKL